MSHASTNTTAQFAQTITKAWHAQLAPPLRDYGQENQREREGPLPQVALVRASTPLRLGPLLSLLAIYPKKVDTLYLAEGLSQGFRIPYTWEQNTYSNNLKSVEGMEHIVQSKLEKEIKLGRISEPYLNPHCLI